MMIEQRGIARERSSKRTFDIVSLAASVLMATLGGCAELNGWSEFGDVRSLPLGSASREIWNEQETMAEASKLVIHEHEFKPHSIQLNSAGIDHVRQIARVVQDGVDFPVVVERTMYGDRQGENHYPVNPNPELDNKRRDIIVATLQRLGVSNADQLVVVAPDFAQSATGVEAEAAYNRGINAGRSSGSFGGGFGGFGGFSGGGSFSGFGSGGISDASVSDSSDIASSSPN